MQIQGKPIGLMRSLVKAALVSGSVMGLGDGARQYIEARNAFDWESVAKFSLVGATLHGPYFLYAFRLVDKIKIPTILSRGVMPVVAKTLIVQATVFPLFVGALYTYLAFLEGQPLETKKDAAWKTVSYGAGFWIPANLINFAFCPPALRVYYVAGAGVAWNTVVSYLNERTLL